MSNLFRGSRTDPLHVPPAVQQEAAVWRLRLRDSHGDPVVREAFERWLAEDPSHEFADAEAEAFQLPADLASREVLAESPLRPARRSLHASRWLPIAASVLVAFGILANGERIANLGAEEASGHQGMRTVTLEDGSRVTLNARSTLDVDLSSGRRQVRLRRGEAYFDIAHDPSRPFVVRAGDADIRVIGTRFNVKLREDQTTVTVDRGVVDLTPKGGASLRLTAGSQAFAEAGRTQRQPNYEPLQASAWRRGRLVFYEAPLSEVIEEINRHRGAPVIILSSEIASAKFSGGLDISDPDAAVSLIARQIGVKVLGVPGGPAIIY